MPSTFIPTPPFPNVPNLPGVPQLTRSPIGAAAAIVPGIIQTLLAPSPLGVRQFPQTPTPIWGVFDAAGEQVISPDSILDFGYRSEFKIPDYPVQQGTFSSYNKIAVPFEIALRMVKASGSASDPSSALQQRTQFENDCEFVAASLDLYTIVTPEKSYVSVNPMRLDFTRREAKGSRQIEAEMYFRQIIEVTPQYSSTTTAAANTVNAQNPGAVPTSNVGLVQPLGVPTTTAQQVNQILHDDPLAGIGNGVVL